MAPRSPIGPVADARKGLFWSVIAQIAVIDIVFSLDSVITAVGMVDQIGVMVAAVVASSASCW
jgi:predicted tellurium resistance membrane protein TerC